MTMNFIFDSLSHPFQKRVLDYGKFSLRLIGSAMEFLEQ